jgi:uncharacterized membrane protein
MKHILNWSFIAKTIICLVFICSFVVSVTIPVSAQTVTVEGQVEEVYRSECANDQTKTCLTVDVFVEGETYEGIQIREGEPNDNSYENFEEGDLIVLSRSDLQGEAQYNYLRPKRTSPFVFLVGAFFVVILVLGGAKGWRSVLSLIFSTALIFFVMLPLFIEYPGYVLIIGILSTFSIYCLNQFIGHGFNKESYISILGGFISFVAVLGISILTAHVFKISGFGNEGSLFISQLLPSEFSLGDLFIVGVLFGLTGAVDDVNATQTHSLSELVEIDPDLHPNALFLKGMNIGSSHLVSIINTLFMAYIGAALPTMILFALLDESALDLIGRDDITEEILRTILASLGLLLAIPVTTWISVFVVSNSKKYTIFQRALPFLKTK